jgi:hypothetical protein
MTIPSGWTPVIKAAIYRKIFNGGDRYPSGVSFTDTTLTINFSSTGDPANNARLWVTGIAGLYVPV